MALSEQQIEQMIDYANEQIRTLVANYNIETFEDDKDLQRMFIAINNLYDELNAAFADYLPPAIYETYLSGLEHAEQLLEVAGLGAVSLGTKGVQTLAQAPLHTEAISNVLSDTLDDLAAAIRTAKTYSVRELDKAFKEVNQELANGMIAGFTTKQITQRVGEKFSDKGMTSFITKDGKHLPLDFYAKTVTRTKMQTAYNHGHLNRYEERNVKHVEVSGNIPTCAECSVYRGIVFATERGDEFPYINLHKTFPVHPNCRCNFRPYIMKFKSDEDIQNAKAKAKSFDPNDDKRSKAEARKYNANQKAKQQARQKRLTFNKMQAKLGKDGPQSFKEFKTASKRQYHDWVAQMNKMYNPNNKQVNNTQADNVQVNDIQVDDPIEEPKQIDYKSIDYTTPNNFDSKSNEYANSIIDKMDNLEKTAFTEYTYNEYVTINNYMRDKYHDNLANNEVTKYSEDLGFIKDFAESMEQAFSKYDIRLQDDVTLYRGIREVELEHIAMNTEELDNGKDLFTLDNFKSTSSDEKQTTMFADDGAGWVIEIKAPKGSRVLSLQTISGLEKEKEYLIANGQDFEIDSIDEENRRIYVYLR